MDKYLILIGFQLTQTAVLGVIDGSAWRLLSGGRWQEALAGLDADAPLLLLQALLSGTWIGKLAELGDLAVALATGARGLPLLLVLLQWAAVLLLVAAERRVLARRLERIGSARG